MVLLKLEKFEEAILWFNKSIQISPDDWNSYINKGLSLASLGKDEEAI